MSYGIPLVTQKRVSLIGLSLDNLKKYMKVMH